MRKWFLAAIAALLFAAGAYAKDKVVKYGGNLLGFPTWTSANRYGTSPGIVGFNITSNLPEWLDNNATWHSFTPTDNPIFSGTLQLTIAYSAAGTPLPTCNAGSKGSQAWVTDATGPTYLAAYTSGGTVVAPVFCNGTSWLTY
jgi:hypothetical protein